MRKWWIIWPLYAGLMGFALGASFFFGMYGRNVTESSIAAQHEQEAAKEVTNPKKEETDEALAYYTLWLMAFTGILAAATIGLGIATLLLYAIGEKQFKFAIRSSIRQSRDTQASIDINKKSADAAIISAQVSKAAIRAVMTLNNYTGGRTLDPSGGVLGYLMKPNITNAGSTHALNATFITAIKVLPIDGEHHFSRESGASPIAAIGPGAHLSSSENIGLMLDDAMKVWRNEAMCLLWSRIDYADIIGDRHHVEQCVRVTFRDDPSFTGEIVQPEHFLIYSAYGPQNTAS